MLLLTAACLVPALSHLTMLPLYQLNPMLFILLGGMLLVDSRANSYILAVLLPLFSCLAVGMPTIGKAVCMVAEYAAVIGVFGLLESRLKSKHMLSVALLMAAALIIGKVAYYAAKALILPTSELITTPIALQLSMLLIASVLYTILSQRKTTKK